MSVNPFETKLEAITNTIRIFDKQNNDEKKEKIEELKKERTKLLKELRVY